MTREPGDRPASVTLPACGERARSGRSAAVTIEVNRCGGRPCLIRDIAGFMTGVQLRRARMPPHITHSEANRGQDDPSRNSSIRLDDDDGARAGKPAAGNRHLRQPVPDGSLARRRERDRAARRAAPRQGHRDGRRCLAPGAWRIGRPIGRPRHRDERVHARRRSPKRAGVDRRHRGEPARLPRLRFRRLAGGGHRTDRGDPRAAVRHLRRQRQCRRHRHRHPFRQGPGAAAARRQDRGRHARHAFGQHQCARRHGSRSMAP